MENIYFITDLDRTIIHSKHKGYKCVEMIGEKEITYMTDSAYEKLMELLEHKNLKFIPCTMRNINQTLRVSFIKEYNPEIIICTNGAEIYINGSLDLHWDKKMKSIVNHNELLNNIKYLNNMKEKLKGKINIIEVRNIENFYITVKCASSEDATKFYKEIKDSFSSEVKVIKIKAKIFIINKKINKLKALDYIVDKYGIKHLITSGDSEVDKGFTTRGISILPKHSSFKNENSIITNDSNIKATEEILSEVEKIIFNVTENVKIS